MNIEPLNMEQRTKIFLKTKKIRKIIFENEKMRLMILIPKNKNKNCFQ